MADTVAETKDTTVGTPEKKEVEKKVVEVVDEDSKASENGDLEIKPKENGTGDEKDDDSNEKVESAENGDSIDSVEVTATKRKSEGGDAPEGTPAEGASPEKKAKLDEAEANGEAEAVA
ncbi:hypothetical protein L9F63_002403 [Diploptera punctata]|uniref:Prothymosin alpha n=1 Tax=Diploptera punctata TaxID=6984 RepID=A0AAD7ZTI8_DIPPU|nr:hypothetical protein L9F63_002403 [Diploptera punctata]